MTDFADWIDAIVVGGSVSTDSTDWSRQITVITGSLPNDFPDWVEATAVSGAGPGSAIQLVSSSAHTNAAAATTITVPTPAGIVSGDLLTAVLWSSLSSSSATITSPGWTQVYQFYIGSAATGNVYVLTRTATGSEPANYIFTGASAVLSAAVLQWSNTAGLDGAPSSSSGITTTVNTYPSLTPTAAGGMLVLFTGSFGNPNVFWSPPAGVTVGPTTQVTAQGAIAVWCQPLSGTSPTGTLTGAQSNSNAHVDTAFLLHA